MKSQYGESDPSSSSCENLHAMESKIAFKKGFILVCRNVENIPCIGVLFSISKTIHN